MMKIRIIIPLFIALFITEKDAEYSRRLSTRESHSAALEYVEKEIPGLMKELHLPGFAITVVNDRETIFQDVYGLADLEEQEKATTETVFKLWSLTKLFTAIEIFREVEEGLVDLDVPITEYLPGFAIKSIYETEKPITVRSLLAHRSGLPRNEAVLDDNMRRGNLMLDRFESSVSDAYSAYPAGVRYKYSNLGYDLLGRIIEQNRKMDYATFMRTVLLSDLGMNNSSFLAEGFYEPADVAKGYEYYKGEHYPMIQGDINNIPSGNLYSTIEDLDVFLKKVIGNDIFKDEGTLSGMFVDSYSSETDPETMGLGWKTRKTESSGLLVWHDGGPADGTGVLVAVLPEERLGIAVIGNATSFESPVTLPFAMDLLSRISGWDPGAEYHALKGNGTDKLNRSELEGYQGKYIAFGQVMDVRARKHKLVAKLGGFRLSLVPSGQSEFRVTHWMDKMGLTRIIRSPMDFDKIAVSFSGGDASNAQYLIFNLYDISHEICPRYVPIHSLPDRWKNIVGPYQVAERLPQNNTGTGTGKGCAISLVDQVLIMSGAYGPVVPLEDHFLRIASGPLAGEIMEYDPGTGKIFHQNNVFVPAGNPAIP